MRKLIGIIAAVIAVSFLGGVGFAEEPVVTVQVTANKTSIVELDSALFEVETTESAYMYSDLADQYVDNVNFISGTEVSFGELTLTEYDKEPGQAGPPKWKVYLPNKYICVMLYPSTSGQPYKLYQEVTVASPALEKSLIVTPGYCSKDLWWTGGPKQGDLNVAAGDSIPEVSMPACGDKKLIYTGGSGKGRMIRALYGIASGNEDTDKKDTNGYPVPVDPPGVEPLNGDDGGNLSATIQFTLTVNG